MTNYPETRPGLILNVKNPTNQIAWQEFVNIYQPVIYRTAVKRGMQDADAHDLSQQVLLSVASAIGRWENAREGVRFRHWLRKVTRNAIVNALARKPKDIPAGTSAIHDLLNEVPQEDSVTNELIQIEYRRELYLRAVSSVREEIASDTWKAFELTTIEGISKSEAAKQLGKSIGTIYASRSRVMKRLREVVRTLEEAAK